MKHHDLLPSSKCDHYESISIIKGEKIKAKANRNLTGFTPTFPVSSFLSNCSVVFVFFFSIEAHHLPVGLYKLIPSSSLSAIRFPKCQ